MKNHRTPVIVGVVAIVVLVAALFGPAACSAPSPPAAVFRTGSTPGVSPCEGLPLAPPASVDGAGPLTVLVVHPTALRADLEPALDTVLGEVIDQENRLSVVVSAASTAQSRQSCFIATPMIGAGANPETRARSIEVVRAGLTDALLDELDWVTDQIRRNGGDPMLDDPVTDVAVGAEEVRRVRADEARVVVLAPGVPSTGCASLVPAAPGKEEHKVDLTERTTAAIRTACRPRVPDLAGLTVSWGGFGRGGNEVTSNASRALRSVLTDLFLDAGADAVTITDALVPAGLPTEEAGS